MESKRFFFFVAHMIWEEYSMGRSDPFKSKHFNPGFSWEMKQKFRSFLP